MDVNELNDTVKGFLGEHLSESQLSSIGSDTPLITGGILDSITLVELVAVLEDKYGVKFQAFEMSVDYFDSLASIGEIVKSKLG